MCKGTRVIDSIAAGSYSDIIATQLPLMTDPPGCPPDCWMVEEQCFHHQLQDIHKVVVTANVREFMSEQCFQLLGCQPHKHGCRNEDHRTKPTDNARHFCQRGNQDAESALNTKPAGEVHKHGSNPGIRLDTMPAQK